MFQILNLEDLKIGIQRGHDGSLIVVCDVNYKKVIEKGNNSEDWIHFYGQVPTREAASALLKHLEKIPSRSEVGLETPQ